MLEGRLEKAAQDHDATKDKLKEEQKEKSEL